MKDKGQKHTRQDENGIVVMRALVTMSEYLPDIVTGLSLISTSDVLTAAYLGLVFESSMLTGGQ